LTNANAEEVNLGFDVVFGAVNPTIAA